MNLKDLLDEGFVQTEGPDGDSFRFESSDGASVTVVYIGRLGRRDISEFCIESAKGTGGDWLNMPLEYSIRAAIAVASGLKAQELTP